MKTIDTKEAAEGMRVIPMNEAVEAIRSVFPDHRPSSRYRASLAENLWGHAIWLGSPIRVTILKDRSRFQDEDIWRILMNGPLGAAKRLVVINPVGTEARPQGAPQVRGAFVVEGKGVEAFLARYHQDVWPKLFMGDTILVAPDVDAAGVLDQNSVVLRIGRPDILRAIQRRCPDVRIEAEQPPSERSDWRAIVEGGEFVLEARGEDESGLVRQVSERMASSRGRTGKVVVAYLDKKAGMSADAAQEIERTGALASDRRSMDILLNLLVPKQKGVSQWEVDSEERL
jgi:hypothetical protein